jgi:hypothetical protein
MPESQRMADAPDTTAPLPASLEVIEIVVSLDPDAREQLRASELTHGARESVLAALDENLVKRHETSGCTGLA